jgi:uncharacterized Zn finger protein
MARKQSPRNRNATRSRPRFDPQALRRIAGAKVFERGVEYHSDGSVEIITVEPNRVVAEVQGTELYRTEVIGGGDDIVGNCTCPAASDWGFCKHMVATALAANALDPDALAAHAGQPWPVARAFARTGKRGAGRDHHACRRARPGTAARS